MNFSSLHSFHNHNNFSSYEKDSFFDSRSWHGHVFRDSRGCAEPLYRSTNRCEPGKSIGPTAPHPLDPYTTSSNGIRTGFLAGLQIDRNFSDVWGISAELLYDQKGTNVNYNESGPSTSSPEYPGPWSQTGTSEVTLNYLEVSLLLKARFGSGNLRPYVFVGPSLGTFLSGKQQDSITFNYTGITQSSDTTRSIPASIVKTFDISFVGGAGVELTLGAGQIIFVDAAYAYGLTNDVQRDGIPVMTPRDIRLAAGILFPAGLIRVIFMRRLIGSFYVFSFLAFCAPSAHAQQKYIGVLLGANFANESLDSLPSGIAASHRMGILAGIQSERWFGPHWGVSLQGIYSQEGHNENLDGVGTGILYGWTRTGSENVKSSSLTADVLVKRSLWEIPPIRTYAFAGIAMGTILSNTSYYNVTVSKPGNPSYATDTTYSLGSSNSFNFSLIVGLGISLKLDSGPMLFLDAGYWYGLTNLYEWYGGTAYTRDIRLTTGILFPLQMPSLLF